jgi:type I restriction enzyme S subunit
MPDDWRTVRLRAVTKQVRERHTPDPAGHYRLLGVRGRGLGPFLREELLGSQTKAVALTPVRRGQFIYNRLFAGTGSFGVVAPELDGSWVSSEFPLFDVDQQHLDADFLGLLFQQPSMWDRVAAECVGTTGSRMRWHERRFAEFEVALPALAEQQRIVDLISVVDSTRKQARKTHASVEFAQRAVLLDLFIREPSARPLVEVLRDLIGGVWGNPPGVDEIEVAALGLSAFNEPTAVVTRLFSTPRSVDRERWNRRGLRADDIVLERSGGTNDRPVGRVIFSAADMDDVIPTDFMRLLRVDPAKAVPRYVFWWLWSCYKRGDTAAFQSKTTNIRNLRVTDYLGQPMPLPTRDAQHQIAAVADDLAELVEKTRRYVDTLTRLRSVLLADLLSGKHEIPASYDRFLNGAA